ncbi:MAG: hypothetical protein C5B51_15445 [Terriglobia bacterium]|nr:MAG: hypothetical protein C5B51_15445 [Terriglobia bacterium]
MKRLAAPLVACAIFLLNVWLNAPLLLPGELPFRGSIEGGYAAMARFISAHPNPWGWNPFQYCGVPTQFLYLPGLPYLTALLVRVFPHSSPDYVYHLITAIFAFLGPVVVFFFALYFTRSLTWSAVVSIAYSLFSPAYGLFPAVEKDRGIVQLPWRIQVLAKYGEGPHNTGLALLPLALLAVWRAGKSRGYPSILLAALLLAAVTLTNWISALALAIACILLLLATLAESDFRVWRVLAAAGLAYFLACFWLTPSFVETIAFNWPADAFGYQFGPRQQGLLAGVLAGAVLVAFVCHKLRASFYFCFVTLCAFVFGWLVTAYYVYGVDTIPESRRYVLEFELFLFLAMTEALRLALRQPNQTVRLCAAGAAGVALLVGLPQLWAYTTQKADLWRPAPREQTVEYRLAQWIAEHPPSGRVFASGGLRFRLNSWFDIPQVGGGFESGLRNRVPVDLAYRIRTGKEMRAGSEAQDTLRELRALGVEYVVVHGARSREYYRDFLRPERLAEVLPVAYHEENDTIYRLPAPRLAQSLAVEELPGKDVQHQPWALDAYLGAMEHSSRPLLRTEWKDAGYLVLDGDVPPDRLVALRINYDPGWRATQDGRRIETAADRLGFLVLHADAAPASHIELHYAGTGEQRVFALLSAVAWVGAFGMVPILWRCRKGAAGRRRYAPPETKATGESISL